jgi:glycosyltransferase involved in cell wall biosynthesis
MHILLVHQNFPGQFRQLAPAWLERGVRVSAVGSSPAHRLEQPGWEGLHYRPYQPPPRGNRGLALRQHLQQLANRHGWQPDLVIAHSGWGEALPIKAVWPHTPLLVYPELWGSAYALGAGFDPRQAPLAPDQNLAIRHHNRLTARALQLANAAVVPTTFQRNSFPAAWQQHLTLIHEGVDCRHLQPDPEASLILPSGVQLDRSTPVISFVSRAFEPLRGLRTFLAALPALLAAHPHLQVVMVGGAGKGYGPASAHPGGHLAAELERIGAPLDLGRLHRPGSLPYHQLCQLFQISRAHVYLTYPYALSWSVLEAMACGTPVVGNHGGPLDELIEPGVNGLLVDFNQPSQLTTALAQVLNQPALQHQLSQGARHTVEQHYSLDLALQRYNALFGQLLNHTSR